jgi:outer membrane protein assembly factor BamD (BamD/ComL family)
MVALVEPPSPRVEVAAVEPPHVIATPAVQPEARPATPRAVSAHAKPSPAPSEASLLGQAWSAIAAGNARHALELAARDARLYPVGAMQEERAAIHVVALAKLGRTTDAHDAAKQFLVRYPTSLHRALVEQSISTESP